MRSNVTLVFLYEDNTDDEESSKLLAELLDRQAEELRQVWHIDEIPVPSHLTDRILNLL